MRWFGKAKADEPAVDHIDAARVRAEIHKDTEWLVRAFNQGIIRCEERIKRLEGSVAALEAQMRVVRGALKLEPALLGSTQLREMLRHLRIALDEIDKADKGEAQ